MTPAIRAAIGLGANVGDAVGTLRGAVEALAVHDGVTLCAVSRFYRTPAWGRQDQPDFVNAVALVDTSLAPRALLDLLLFGDAMIDAPGLRVPHPHLHERAFALVPLLDVWPDARIPGYGDARDAVSTLEISNIHPL